MSLRNGSGTPGRGAASVLIPAYEAGEFIDRTLGCARAQTHARMRIVVSVDLSGDATEEICRAHAAADPRVEVHTHRERLGWARNINFLLDRAAETEFAFIYPHDDVIEPEYCERLAGALEERPDAASAHCDVAQFGTVDTVIAGRSYDGPAPTRLLDFLGSHRMPSLFRSMTRTRLTDHLRLSTEDGGLWANQPYQMLLVTAGPVLHVPGALYRKWAIREGGTTDGWAALPVERLVAAYSANADAMLAEIDALDATAAEREVLRFALGVRMMLSVRRAEELGGGKVVHAPEAVHPAFAGLAPPQALADRPKHLRRQCEHLHMRLVRRTRKAERLAAAVA